MRPPYLDRTRQASLVGHGIFFLDGARGSGKSATRLTIAKSIWQEGAGVPLVVALTNFNVFRPYVRSGLTLDLFATQIAFLTFETILSWLSSLSEAAADSRIASIDPAGKKLVDRFASNFCLIALTTRDPRQRRRHTIPQHVTSSESCAMGGKTVGSSIDGNRHLGSEARKKIC